jgi:Kef-type K+ transport system membrane component KefB
MLAVTLTLTGPSSLTRLALSVAVICACALAAGGLSRRLGQPRVIGEIAAGILLGPTLLGWALPGVFAFLFPADLRHDLHDLARIGVILFVFFVGLEFQSALGGVRWRLTASIVAGSLLVPLVLGAAVALPLYSELGGDAVSRGAFALFLAVAVSITAVPVLATILDDLGLTTRPLGVLAIACAVATDLAAWCLLAVVAAQTGSGGADRAWLRLLLGAAVAVGAILVVRPLLRRLLDALPARAGAIATPILAVGLAVGLASATEHAGVSVVFGAFVAGLAFDPGRANEPSLAAVRVLNRYLLLPIFFVSTGLSVDLHGNRGTALWAAGALVLAVATVGKVGGVSLAGRAGGLGWRDALGLGALLNTKGLTEMVVLDLGYQLGVISQGALGVLIVVALVTTAAAAPAVRRIGLGPAGAGAQVPEGAGATVSA